MRYCSFGCPKADNDKAQYAACLAINGVFCGVLMKVVEKGTPCPLEKDFKTGKTRSKNKKAGG
jgi:hypothetical protein